MGKFDGVLTNKGFSLIETMFSVGIVAGIAMAMVSANMFLSKAVSKASGRSQLDIFRRNLVALVSNPNSWTQTTGHPSNAMNCLTSGGGGTTNTSTPTDAPIQNLCLSAFGYPICGPMITPPYLLPAPSPTPAPTTSSCTNIGAASAKAFALLDAQGNVFYDGRNPANGVTASGELCGPHGRSAHARSRGFPSAACPYSFALTWFVTSGNAAPTVGVNVQLNTDSSINYEQIGAFNLNPANYSVPTIYRTAQ